MAFPNPIDASFEDKLDADFVAWYNTFMAINPATHGVTIQDMRATPKKYASPWCNDFSYEPFVRDMQLAADDGHQFAVRCYYPDERTSPFGKGPYPVYINFHGGGYTFGDLSGDAELCMLIRNRVGILVLDVDYRLCPENMFLKGHEDAWAAIRWVHNNAGEINARADCISIGGISAGGHISAVCQQLARDANLPLQLAILAVPATTCHLYMQKASDSPFASFVENEVAPCLNWKRMKYFMGHAAPKNAAEKEVLDKYPGFWTSPIDGNLRGVCDTFVATAERDPLRDEGEAYAQKLVEQGVRVGSRRYTGVPHPFMHMLVLDKAKMYMEDVCAELKRVSDRC